MTCGFSVHISEICDAGISDHYPVIFEPAISYVQPILSQSSVFYANTIVNSVSLIPSLYQIQMPLCHLVWTRNYWLKRSTLPVVML